MAAIRFELGANVLQFSKGIQYPVSKPVEKSQVVDRTGGGTLQVEELGVTIRQFPIVFKGLPLADYNGLMYWHDHICNGAEHEFTYYDEEGNPNTVKCLTTRIDFPQISYQRFSGELLLEVVG
ncbi:MAG: hypothetical protein KJ804_09065 [Proteobacteria bacterium]|nr:hypothetical protein [Pseudomonadota bacterium]MBU1058449.1 hypothetical protein [Pseudomonadota bacterium]